MLTHTLPSVSFIFHSLGYLSSLRRRKCPLLPRTGILSKLFYFSKGTCLWNTKGKGFFVIFSFPQSHNFPLRQWAQNDLIGMWVEGIKEATEGLDVQGKCGLIFERYLPFILPLDFAFLSDLSKTLALYLILLVFLIFCLCSFYEHSDSLCD